MTGKGNTLALKLYASVDVGNRISWLREPDSVLLLLSTCWFMCTPTFTPMLDLRQIHHAAQHPVELDRAQADAVEARIILDLKVGAAFTRMQTQILQARFGQLAEGKNVVSYGWRFSSIL